MKRKGRQNSPRPKKGTEDRQDHNQEKLDKRQTGSLLKTG